MNKFSKIIVETSNHLLPITFSAILIFTCAVTTPLNGEILLGLGIIFCAILSIIFFIIKDNTIIKEKINWWNIITSIIFILDTILFGWLGTVKCIEKMPIHITYSQEQIEEVYDFYISNYGDIIGSVDAGYCESRPSNFQELEELLENYFDIQINLKVKVNYTSSTAAYVELFDFGRHNIYLNYSLDEMTNICFYISHEIYHLKGSINEARTSYSAASTLLQSDNIFLKASGAKMICYSLKDGFDDIYNFNQLICQDYYQE